MTVTGYLNTEVLTMILSGFLDIDIWSTLVLSAFLLSDNLAIHTNSDIVSATARRKAHMYNTMPHSPHWFQVHEQKPFEILKQQLEARRNNVTSLAHHDPSVRRRAFADNLYQDEVKA